MEPSAAAAALAAGPTAEEVCADNPYEQKLYSMFCGHDKDHRGWLTVNALQQLCKTLELKENGTKLIAALEERCRSKVAGEKKKSIRITFKAFKEELLHVLGTEVQCGGQSTAMASTKIVPERGPSSHEEVQEEEEEDSTTQAEDEEEKKKQLNGGRSIVDQWRSRCSVANRDLGGGGQDDLVVCCVHVGGGGGEQEEKEESEEDSLAEVASKSTQDDVLPGK